MNRSAMKKLLAALAALPLALSATACGSNKAAQDPPLAGAAIKGDLAMVKLLLEAGAQLDGASFDGRTALMMAAMFNRTEIVDYLLAQGADPHAKDANGVTALAAAQTMGAADTVAQLGKLL